MKFNSTRDVVKRIIFPISATGRNITMDILFINLPLPTELLRTHNLTNVGASRKNIRQMMEDFLPNKSKQVFSLFRFKKEKVKKRKYALAVSSMYCDAKTDPLSDKQ